MERAYLNPTDTFPSEPKSAAQKSPDLAARKTDIFVCGLVLVMGRLAFPWQLIRLATRAAESDDAARVAETPFADAVAIVLSEIECMVSECASSSRRAARSPRC